LNQIWKNENWAIDCKHTFIYDSHNNLLTDLTEAWQDECWKDREKYTYTYDAQNNKLTKLNQLFYENGSTDMKNMWTYDENNNSTLVELWGRSSGENWRPAISSLTILYYNNMQSNVEYGFSHKVTAGYVKVPKPLDIVETLHATSLQVYPNPTTGELQITNDELGINNVEIFDIFGRKLNHLITSSSNHLINISHLPSGVYIVKIGTEAGEVVRKVIKN
jgi:hypothetical protein